MNIVNVNRCHLEINTFIYLNIFQLNFKDKFQITNFQCNQFNMFVYFEFVMSLMSCLGFIHSFV